MIPTSCDTCSHFYHCQGSYLEDNCQWQNEQEELKQEHKSFIEVLKSLFH